MAPVYCKLGETQKVFHEGLLHNEKVNRFLPPEAARCASRIEFTGSSAPSLAINWRFAESVSALKALEATMVNVLLLRKYNIEPPKVTINV